LPKPQISFGIIVLNGEPFTRYNLRSLYPWAHQIIVVEGACIPAKSVADTKGHSIDGTIDVLRRFQAEEDIENKLIIITAEDKGHPNGFWPGEKDEMSQAYTKCATGNILWQIDIDEFYHEEDMPEIIKHIDFGADTITFPTYHFWGGIEFVEDGEFLRVHKAREFHRIFRWGVGYTYETHRPPTVLDEKGINLRSLHWIRAGDLQKKNIFMYHYSMLLPKQVFEKCSYYKNVDWASFKGIDEWAEKTFIQLKNLFNVCSTLHIPLSWLEEYNGRHPRQILEMITNIRLGKHPTIELRSTKEIFCIIKTPQYRLGRIMRKIWVKNLPYVNKCISLFVHAIKKTPLYPYICRGSFIRELFYNKTYIE